MQVEGIALLGAVYARVVAGGDNAADEVAERHGDAGHEIGVGSHAVVVKGYARNLGRGLADAVLLESLNLLEPLRADAGGGAHRVVVAQLHLAQVLRAYLGHERARSVKLGLALDGVYLAVNNDALAVDGDGVDVNIGLGQAVAVRAGGVGAAVAGVIARGHVEAHGQLALGDLQGGLALLEHVDEGVDVHGAAGDEVGLGRMAGLGVDADAGNLGHRLAAAVVLKERGLLEPLLAYRAGGYHVIFVLEVGLGGPGGAFRGGEFAAGVEVYLGLHAVEVNVGDGTVSGQGEGACGNIDLGQAVGVGGGVGAGAAVGAALLQIEGVALLGAVYARVVAGVDNAVDEVGKRHGDAGHEICVGSHAALVNSYARNLVGSLADAVLLESPDLLVPLRADAARAAHGVLVVELHLAADLAGEVGGDGAAGVEVGLALDGVYLAVNNDALAVDGDGVDVHVGLGQAVGIRARAGRTAVSGGVGGSHVEAQGQFSLGDLCGIAGLTAGSRFGVCARRGGAVLHHGHAAASQQAYAQKQRKYNCCQLFHFVFTSR